MSLQFPPLHSICLAPYEMMACPENGEYRRLAIRSLITQNLTPCEAYLESFGWSFALANVRLPRMGHQDYWGPSGSRQSGSKVPQCIGQTFFNQLTGWSSLGSQCHGKALCRTGLLRRKSSSSSSWLLSIVDSWAGSGSLSTMCDLINT
jgi:hypothetical protein